MADRPSEQVAAREDARYAAMLDGDIHALQDLLADELIYVHTTGDEDTKASYLAAVESGTVRYRDLSRTEGSVATHGNTVICTGRQLGMSYLHGVARPIDSAYLAVWTRASGAWQLAAWHATRYGPTR